MRHICVKRKQIEAVHATVAACRSLTCRARNEFLHAGNARNDGYKSDSLGNAQRGLTR